MAREFVTDINLRGNRLTNALLTVESSDTTTALYPEVGRIIIDDGVLKYHDGTVWKTVGEGTGGGGGGAASSLSYSYLWKTNTAATDPGHGNIKGNSSTMTAITELYVSAYENEHGEAVLMLRDLVTGSDLVIYEAGSGSTWNRYVLGAPPVEIGTPTEWLTLQVTYAETGALPFTPGNNTAVMLTLPDVPEVDEVYVGTTPPPDPFDGQVWINLFDPVGGSGTGSSGSTILSGTAAPTGSIGAVGDFYLDTDDRVLYGPKGAAVPNWPVALYGATDIRASTTAPTSPDVGDVWIDLN